MKKSSTVCTGDDARRRRRHFRAEWSAKGCHGPREPLSYTDKYPLTKNSWVGINGGRMAEIALAPGERSRRP